METIAGKQLKTKWNLDSCNLAYIILKHNLMVLDFNRRSGPPIGQINPVDFVLESEKIIEIIQNDVDNLSAKHFYLPQIIGLEENGIFEFYEKRLYKSDLISSQSKVYEPTEPWDGVLAKEQKKDLITENQENTIKNVIEEHESEIKKSANAFSLLGKIWFVKYQTRFWGLYQDFEKYRYIAHVLSLSEKAMDKCDLKFGVRNTDLYCKVKKRDPNDISMNNIPHDGLAAETDLTNKIGNREMNVFKEVGEALLEKLKTAVNFGLPEKVMEAEQKLNKFKSIMLSTYGIVVRPDNDLETLMLRQKYNPTNPKTEKLRQVIKNHIRYAVKDFRERMPALSKHLKKCIKPKTYETCYEPEQQIVWYVSP